MGRRGSTFIVVVLCLLASFCLVQSLQDRVKDLEKEKALLMEKELLSPSTSSNSRSWAKATIVDEDEDADESEVAKRDLAVPEETNTKQKRKCANDCSMHGSCQNDGTCNCYSGYAGADCSIVVTPLSSGQPVHNTVLTKEWQYYDARVTTGQELKLVVNSTSGDCDLFVQVGHLPTREDYYQRDVSSGAVKNFVMDLKNPPAGQWFIGMFGFSTCAYTLTGTIVAANSDCPNGCSNAGSCIQSKCHCNAFYGGDDCSMHANLLSSGQKFTDSLGAHQWNYYAFNLARENTFAVIINETGSQGDVDVFVKYSTFPNQTFWDYRDISTQHNFALTVATTTRGYYYIGVFGFLATTYQIQVVPYSSCLNYCSKHGQCIESGCRCNGGYTGTVCETMVGDLTDGATVSGFVSSDMWNYYHFTANTVNTITVTVNQQVEEPGADCDVYVKRGSNPTLTSFDYRNTGTTTNIQLEIPNPQFNTWYVGIYGYATCTYTVSQTASSRCPSTCVPPYGTCTSDGVCDCNDGWSGDDCQTPVQTLTLGVTYGPDMIATGRWKYFYFNTTSSSIVVHMKEVEDWSIGYYWLFVSEQEFPTLSDHDYSDMNTNTQEHTIRFQTDKDPDDDDVLEYYVGVYGSPFDLDTGDNHRGTYKLVAWGPPF